MKRIVSTLILLIILLTSCGNSKEETYNAHKKLIEMKSYAATAEVTVFSNKGATNYKVKQYYVAPNKLRVETLEPDFLKGKILVYNGEKWRIHHPLINQTMDINELKDGESFIYLGIIQNGIMSSEDTKYSRAVKNDADYIEIKSTIPGGNKYRRFVTLYLNQKEYCPELMEILDEDNKVSVSVKYFDFAYNMGINDSLFKLD